MQWLLVFGLTLSIGLVARGEEGETEVDQNDEYMEQFLQTARYLIKTSMDEKDRCSYTIEQRKVTKQDVDGYLFNIDYNAYAVDSKKNLVIKNCQASVHFVFDGETETNITKGPDCNNQE